jgi:hypothetical protein
MKIGTTQAGQYSIAVSMSELITISNCLNEVCHGIELFEFETRIGANKAKVVEMLDLMLGSTGQR